MDQAERYAEQHRKYLEDNRPDVLKGLSRSGDLPSYLSSIGEQASDRLDHAMAEHSRATANLPYQERVTELQSRQREAEELIQHDLINQPAPQEDDDLVPEADEAA